MATSDNICSVVATTYGDLVEALVYDPASPEALRDASPAPSHYTAIVETLVGQCGSPDSFRAALLAMYSLGRTDGVIDAIRATAAPKGGA